ncbi:MAG: translation initiation factor IF-2, partial [Eubacterium sp.]|nr:translation initiation factor IF-2 [Eubacterium sp.]
GSQGGERPQRPAFQKKGGPVQQAPEAPVSQKKPGRDAGHTKDKDKRELRENKFSGERRGGRGGQKQMIPRALQKPAHHKEEKKEVITEVQLPEKMTIRELAELLKMPAAQIVKDLFIKGEMYTVNQEVLFEKAEEICMSYDIIAELEEKVDVIAEMLKDEDDDEEKMVSRPPVVCVMGHVDHGKTSLLDAVRHAHVTDREAGGITQNIGAYSVRINDRKITFLDTPGHEAFTAMRMRGASSTDIAILVVAADDGVMPQTVEAINHAKAAGVEIVVAINKIDKPGANIERVKQELIEHELVPVDWGGSTEFVPVSAKTKEGLDDLLETVLLTADILELKANPKRKARGLVLEARLDKGKGPVVSILVQKGTLRVGDYIACGTASGKVRAMIDENGKNVKEARPSTPVEVLGLNDVPNAGEILVALNSDKEAKDFAATFISENKRQLLEDTKSRMSLDALFDQMQEGTLKELELVLKADVQGSVEALKQSLLKLSNEEVLVKIIHSGVGAISESDIMLAAASNAIIIGFNVRPDPVAKATAEQEKIDVRLYSVIYQAIDDIEAAMKGMLEPIYEEKIIGHAEVRQLFHASGVGTIAGSYILNGYIQRGCKVRIMRREKQIFEGNLASLKRFKDDVKEVKAGYECGLVFDGFNEVQELDQVEAYIMVEVPRK